MTLTQLRLPTRINNSIQPNIIVLIIGTGPACELNAFVIDDAHSRSSEDLKRDAEFIIVLAKT